MTVLVQLKDPKIEKITIPAMDIMNLLLQERLETGRIYIMNIDNANNHSAFLDKISMSNLCQEVNLSTSPVYDIHDGKVTKKMIRIKKDKLEEYKEWKNNKILYNKIG